MTRLWGGFAANRPADGTTILAAGGCLCRMGRACRNGASARTPGRRPHRREIYCPASSDGKRNAPGCLAKRGL